MTDKHGTGLFIKSVKISKKCYIIKVFNTQDFNPIILKQLLEELNYANKYEKHQAWKKYLDLQYHFCLIKEFCIKTEIMIN